MPSPCTHPQAHSGRSATCIPAECSRMLSRPAPASRRSTSSDACRVGPDCRYLPGNYKPLQSQYNTRLSCLTVPIPDGHYLRVHQPVMGLRGGSSSLEELLRRLCFELLARPDLQGCSYFVFSCFSTKTYVCTVRLIRVLV